MQMSWGWMGVASMGATTADTDQAGAALKRLWFLKESCPLAGRPLSWGQEGKGRRSALSRASIPSYSSAGLAADEDRPRMAGEEVCSEAANPAGLETLLLT